MEASRIILKYAPAAAFTVWVSGAVHHAILESGRPGMGQVDG
jgi:hypothetical protein